MITWLTGAPPAGVSVSVGRIFLPRALCSARNTLAEIRIGVLEADGKFSFLREDDVRKPSGTDGLTT